MLRRRRKKGVLPDLSLICIIVAMVGCMPIGIMHAHAFDIESELSGAAQEEVLNLGEESDGKLAPVTKASTELLDDTELNAIMRELEATEPQAESSNASQITPLATEGYVELPKESAPPVMQAHTVTLRILNKIIARSQNASVKVGRRMHADALEISVLQCLITGEGPQRESKALLQIAELKPDQEPETLFYGWMLGHSPSVSTLEHPMYDVTLVTCQ